MMPFHKRLNLICLWLTVCCSSADMGVAYCQIGRFPASNDRPVNARQLQTRLRISWGGGAAKRFGGTIRITNAKFSRPAILGFNADSPGSVLVQPDQILVRPLTDSSFEGVDVLVTGSEAASVSFEFSEAGSESITRELAVSEIMNQDQVFTLDDENNRLSVVRAAGDKIDISVNRPHLIFDPGEEFRFEMRVNESPMVSYVGDCLLDLVSARKPGRSLHSETIRVNHQQTDRQQHAIKVPIEEGVYNLRFQIKPQRSNSLYRRRTFDREVQFVVLNPNQRRSKANSYLKLVQEIGPEALRSSLTQQQLSQFSRMIGLKTNQAVGRYDVANDEPVVRLPVGGWQAVPIKVQDVGEPHVIEIDYSMSDPMSLGFSILQPDVTGQIPNFGFDSGLYVPNSIVKPKSQSTQGRHRFCFWPNSEQVYLLIANRHQTRPANYQGIRVFQNVGNSRTVDQTKRPASIEKRRVMSFLEQPLLAENFAVNNVVDPVLRQPIHDWVSFYESVNRLAQFLVDSESGGAFINVMGEGSSLLPLTTLQPSPRYDSGIFSAAANDPIRKDVVELIYRIFERENLKFVPVLTFDHRNASFEFDENLMQQARLTDFRGQTVSHDNYPVYNPLNTSIQESVLSTIREVADRYRSKSSYKGIAVVCRPDTHTLLPGSRIGGYDPRSLRRFDPEITSATTLLSNNQFDDWIQWRKAEMNRWYQQMRDVVCEQSGEAKLYLAMIDIFKNEELQGLLAPSLHRPLDLESAISKLGLDLKTLNEQNNLVVMQPETLAPVHSLASRKSDIAAKLSPQWAQWKQANVYPASLFLHRSSWARFENLEASAVFSRQETPILRLQHLNPASVWNRERFAKALLTSDARELADGGLILNTNLDPELKAFKQVFAELPNIKFKDVAHRQFANERNPVAVRFVNVGESTYLYCVNGSPWSIDLEVRPDRSIDQSWQTLGAATNKTFATGQGGDMKITLEPFELFAVKASTPKTGFADYVFRLPETANRELNKTYYELRARVIASGKVNPLKVLQQPSFETGAFSGAWNVGSQSSGIFEFESKDAFDGRYSLKIQNLEQQTVWIRSNPIQVPVTGRLSVSVWLKAENPDIQPPFRISIESAETGSNYYRFAEVGALAKDRGSNQLSPQWRRFVVHFDDLPAETDTDLRIGFDLMGSGTVWVDQVQVYDRWMDEFDLKALTQMFAGVGPLIGSPRKWESCRQILNGYWPQFLREYFDEDNAVQNQESKFGQPIRSTMRRRFRRFVSPGIFQFR